MSGIYQRLLRNRFLILVLSLSLAGFIILYFADTYFKASPRLSDVLRSISVALLTSFVVGFVFDYVTYKELSGLISSIMQEQLERFFGHAEEEHLYAFWRNMLHDGLTIVIPEDETGKEPMVRASDISASMQLYTQLIHKYGLSGHHAGIAIEFISKNNPAALDLRTFQRNLVIVGAPGGNPLATAAFKFFYHLPRNVSKVQNGYVFAVDRDHPEKYLESPFIIPQAKGTFGIRELRNGKVVAHYDRIDPSHRDGVGRDACLLITGQFLNNVGHAVRVMMIAGCSRFSTMDGIEFVVSNENWAHLLSMREKEPLTATVLETSISLAHGRVVQIARPPHAVLP